MPSNAVKDKSEALKIYHAKCDDADARCRTYTDQHLDGEIEELELRQLILAEITELKVVQSTIPHSYTPAWREEAVARLEDILVRRFMEMDTQVPLDPEEIDPDTGLPKTKLKKAFFSPMKARMDGTTYIGAARNLCFQALQTVNRDIHSSRRRNGATIGDDPNENIEDDIDPAISAEDVTIEKLGWGLNSEVTDRILELSRTIRTGNQRETVTRALLKMHGFPELIRLPITDRRHLLALIEEDNTLAFRSAAYVHEMRGGGRPRGARPDEAMMSLWDDFSLANLERLRELSPRVAEAFVIDAISDRARPSRSVIREFTRAIVQMGSGRSWKQTANSLQRVFIAVECEALAVCDSTKGDAEGVKQRLAGREMTIATEDEVYAQLFNEHPDNPLGMDRETVQAKLTRLLDRCTGLEEILLAGLKSLKEDDIAA